MLKFSDQQCRFTWPRWNSLMQGWHTGDISGAYTYPLYWLLGGREGRILKPHSSSSAAQSAAFTWDISLGCVRSLVTPVSPPCHWCIIESGRGTLPPDRAPASDNSVCQKLVRPWESQLFPHPAPCPLPIWHARVCPPYPAWHALFLTDDTHQWNSQVMLSSRNWSQRFSEHSFSES